MIAGQTLGKGAFDPAHGVLGIAAQGFHTSGSENLEAGRRRAVVVLVAVQIDGFLRHVDS
jgi:hypothetical protein